MQISKEQEMKELLAIIMDCGTEDIDILLSTGMDVKKAVREIKACGDVDLDYNMVYKQAANSKIIELFGYDALDDFEITPNCQNVEVLITNNEDMYREEYPDKLKELEDYLGEEFPDERDLER